MTHDVPLNDDSVLLLVDSATLCFYCRIDFYSFFIRVSFIEKKGGRKKNMAGRAVSLLEVLASKSSLITKTTAVPSSSAATDLWRKYFDKEEEKEEEENVEQIATTMQEMETEMVNPIASPNVIEARNDFVLEYWRNISRSQPPPPRNSRTERIVSTPDLRIPAGEGLFLNIAQ